MFELKSYDEFMAMPVADQREYYEIYQIAAELGCLYSKKMVEHTHRILLEMLSEFKKEEDQE